jgi:hypothetical protein
MPALGRLNQDDSKFKASLGCTEDPVLKKKKKKTSNPTSKFIVLKHTYLVFYRFKV